MTKLSDFEKDAGPFRGAFRMDCERGVRADMRKHVGLGDCDCCDYFRPLGTDTIVLVEKTHLTQTLQNYQQEFASLRAGGSVAHSPARAKSAKKKAESEKEYIDNRIMWENRLKVYGGMLVLCRYAAQCSELAAMLRGKKFHFLLVDMGVAEAPNKKGAEFSPNAENASDAINETELDYWRRKLGQNFRNLFTSKLLSEVNVIRFADLARELPPD